MHHIHAVAVTDDGIFVGTHNGMWQVSEEEPATRVSADEWDVMGLTYDGEQFLASGHPGPEMNAPGNLGLQRSSDTGSTWTGVSLVGDVDFHRLAAHRDTIAGIDSHSGLLLSSQDGGERWRATDAARFIDVAVLDSGDVIALTADSRWRSGDGGESWQQIAEDSLIPVVVTATGQELVATDPRGRILVASAWDAPWRVIEANVGRADGIFVHGDTIAVVAEDQVLISRDGGASFAAAKTGR